MAAPKPKGGTSRSRLKRSKKTTKSRSKRTLMSWDKFQAVVGSALKRIYLYGPPGIGKSHISLAIARAASNKDPFQVTLNEDITVQELIGHYIPEGNKFVWHDGPIAQAWREGVPLIVNEVARASGAVQDLLLSVLDDPSIASIALPTGERLKPAEGFRAFATANTPPSDLDEALRDRFDAAIEVSTPHPHLVQALNAQLNGIGDFIAESYKDKARSVSPRKAFAFLLLSSTIDAKQAAEIIFENPQDVLAVMRSRGIEV